MKRVSRTLRRAATCLAARFRQSPFLLLVRHFLRRMANAGGDKGNADMELGAGPLLALLVVPGAFQCLLSLNKYSSLMNYFRSLTQQDLVEASVPDKLLFIAISMAMTGLVCVLSWDRLLPNLQDFQNLVPMPIPRRTILAANTAAIAIAAAIVNVAVNAASAIMFPAFVSAAAPDHSIATGQFLIAHAAAVGSASVFAFLFIMAAQGTAAVLTNRDSHSATILTRVVLLVALVFLIPLAIETGTRLRTHQSTESLAWFPGLWFLDLYQGLQSRGATGRANLTPMAGLATGVSLAVAVASCGFLYRRRLQMGVASERSGEAAVLLRWMVVVLRFACPVRPVASAIRDFTLFGLWRSDLQRLLMLFALGSGWLVALQNLDEYPTAPLIPAFLLVLAMSVAVRMPVALASSWAFRVILDGVDLMVSAPLRQMAMFLVVVLVVVPAAVGYALTGLAWRESLIALVVVGCVSWAHVELVFGRWRQIPFTRPLEPFRQSFPATCLLQVLAFFLVVWCGIRAHSILVANPAGLAIVVGLSLVPRWWNYSQREEARLSGCADSRVSFEERNEDAIQVLNLN